MRITKLIYVSVLMIVSLLAVNAQDVTVTAAFDTSSIFIGDQILFRVKVEHTPGIPIQIQKYRDTLYKNIEILAGPETDSSYTGNDRLVITDNYLITSFDTGFYQVPPVFAEIRSESGIKRFYSDYSVLEVMRINIAPSDSTAKIFDIIKPYRAALTIGEIIPWLLIVLAAAGLVWFIIRIIRRLRKPKGKEEIVISPDPAHIIAFRDLEKLRNDQLWQRGEVKLYYSRLTEILRKYLENRFGVFSLEMTTSETLEELRKTGFKKDESYEMLKNTLNGADLVKFAKYKPEPTENEMHFENSWRFVDMTKIRPEPVEKTGSEDKTENKL